MRVPKYQNQSPVSLGGTYRQTITQQSAGRMQPGQRDTRAYLVDASAGQVSSQLVAQAHASAVNITDAVVDAGNDIYEAFREADGASEYAKAKSSFELYNRAQVHSAKSEPFLMPNPDKKGKYDFVPAFPHMSENYLKDAQENIKAYAATINHVGYRNKFLAAANADLATTYNQIENYRHTKHIEYLKGEVQARWFEATTIEQVLEVAQSKDAMMSMTGEEIFDGRQKALKRVSQDYFVQLLAEASTTNDGEAFSDIYHRVFSGGRVGPDGEIIAVPEDQQFLKYLDSDDRMDIANQVIKLEDRLDDMIEDATEGAYATELQNIILSDDYNEDMLYDWLDRHPNSTAQHHLGLRKMLIDKGKGPIVEDLDEYYRAKYQIDAVSYYDIVSADLGHEKKSELLNRLVEFKKGKARWETTNWGRRAKEKLARSYKAFVDPATMYMLPAEVQIKKAQHQQEYHEVLDQLDDYLYGSNFDESQYEQMAWEWVNNHVTNKRNNDPQDGNSGTTEPFDFDVFKNAPENNEDQNFKFKNVQMIFNLPDSEYRSELVDRLKRYNYQGEIPDPVSIEDHIEQGNTAESWYHRILKGWFN